MKNWQTHRVDAKQSTMFSFEDRNAKLVKFLRNMQTENKFIFEAYKRVSDEGLDRWDVTTGRLVKVLGVFGIRTPSDLQDVVSGLEADLERMAQSQADSEHPLPVLLQARLMQLKAIQDIVPGMIDWADTPRNPAQSDGSNPSR